MFCKVVLSLSAPLVPDVAPPTEIPYPMVVATPVFNIQFLTVLFIAPAPAPKLVNAITVGAVVAELVIVRLRLVLPLLLPSMVT